MKEKKSINNVNFFQDETRLRASASGKAEGRDSGSPPWRG